MRTKIDLLGAFRHAGNRSVTCQAGKLDVYLDEDAIAREVTQALAQQIRENLLTGRTPEGMAMPPASPATIRKRLHEGSTSARLGFVTGLLARSFVAVKDLGGWAVRLIGERAREEGTLALFERIGFWTAKAMMQPRIVAALRSVQAKLVKP